MNTLNPFATLNLTTALAQRHTHVLLDAGAQSFVIAPAESLERIAGILDSLRKTRRVRLGVEGEIAPGTRVRLTGGPYERREGVAVCLPVFGGKVADQYWVRLFEEGGLSDPVSAPPSWLASLPPLRDARTKGSPRDLRSFSFDARYGRAAPVFDRLDDVVLHALDTLLPGDVIVLGAEEYREHVAELIASRGRTDLHLAVAPHSYLAKALITDGPSLGSTGVFLGYADANGTAVINVEDSCTQTLPAGFYYLLNDYPLANCPEDELLEHLSCSPAYEYKFSSCGHCHAQGFHLDTHQWHCPMCGFSNPSEIGSRFAAGERVDFGPTLQQLDAAYELIERHRDVHLPTTKVIRITGVHDRRERPVRGHVCAGMFAVGGRELPDECSVTLSQTGTCYATGPGLSGTDLLSHVGHTQEEAFDKLLRTLGPKNVASLKAGEGLPNWGGGGGKLERLLEPIEESVYELSPYKTETILESLRPHTKQATILGLPEPRPVRLRPSPLPPPDETRVTTISYLVEADGRRLDSSARLIGLGGAARLESGMYVIVPSDWPSECAVKVLHNTCTAVTAEGKADRVFPVWPQDTARAAAEEYDRRLAARADAEPAVTAFGTRRILDICESVAFQPALSAAVEEARDGDAVVVYNEHEMTEARRALRDAGKQTVIVALGPDSTAGSPVLVTGGHLLGAPGMLVGGTGVPGHFFIFAQGGSLLTLKPHDFWVITTKLSALVASAKVAAASRAQGGGTSALLIHQPREAGAARLQLAFAADCARPEGLDWRVVVLYGPEEAGELEALAALARDIRPGVRVGTLTHSADELTGRRDHFTLATAEGFGSLLGRIAAGAEGYHRGMFDAAVVAEGYAPSAGDYLHFLKGRLDAKLLAAWTSAPPPEDVAARGGLTAGSVSILPAETPGTEG